MAELRWRRLRRGASGRSGDKFEVQVPLPRSASGKIYRYCPSEECTPRLFQLGAAPEERPNAPESAADRHREPGTPGTTCPYCGRVDEDDAFTWQRDIEHAKRILVHDAMEAVQDYLREMVSEFNRGMPTRGLITARMDFQPGHTFRPRLFREDLLRDISCHACARRYGVYAISLFCPDCSAVNLLDHFSRESELVSRQSELADQARSSQKLELAYRLLGNAHEDVLTAFETALKTVYGHLVRHKLPDQADELLSTRTLGSAFQNIDKARKLFGAIGVDLFSELDERDHASLRLNIEKRHVIGHNLGLVDEKYAQFDEVQEPGQTVRLLSEDILQFASTCRSVLAGLEKQISKKADEA